MLEEVRAGGLLPAGTPVVAMLSGGRDSVCLLDLAVRALGAGAVTALHVNYGLRDDSDDDERHCAELCERLGVAARGRAAAPAGGPRQPAGLGARHPLRRRGPAGAAALGATIATGHTADDQVETILYRLASSPSRRALLGMRPRDGRLARPLLAFTRAETTAYCEERGLAWRDDATNAEPAYARNRVRHGLLPALAEIHPAAARERAAHRGAAARRGRGPRRPGRRRARRLRLTARPAARSRSSASPSCPRRCAASSSSGSPTAPPAGRSPAPPATPRRSPALRRTGTAMLDLGGGVRAVVERGVLRAER